MGNVIGLQVLYELGYRVCHAKNISTAVHVLEKMADGKAVNMDDVRAALAALRYAPLSQANVIGLPTPSE